jgi:hypothetical protein
MTTGYDIAQVCTSGHVVNSMSASFTEGNRNFCQRCGAKTIRECEACQAPIPGYFHSNVISIGGGETKPPAFCGSCGAAYPWTEAGRIEWNELLDLDSDLSDDERARLKQSLDALIVDGPGTPRAALIVKRLLPKAGSEIANAAKSVLLAIATAKAKQELGL